MYYNEVSQMQTKKCSACKQAKPVDEFHKNRSTHDGLQTECKLCRREMQRNNHSPEYVREQARRYRASYHDHPERKKKAYARYKVWRAVKLGRLIPQPCIECGSRFVQAHHEDYDAPLDIQWRCKQHHENGGGRYHEVTA